jgi:hypothetical protein
MVIFTPVLSEEEFKASQKKYADFIVATKVRSYTAIPGD